jgi:transposase-like protein
MNLLEIAEQFPEKIDEVAFFESYRWPDGIRCAYCSSTNIISRRMKDLRHWCRSCHRSFSVTTNTQLHNTRMPLKKWLFAFAIVSDAKKGLSALQLHRNLGVEYVTSWRMYHKMRDLMEMDNQKIEELDNIVEMDETYVGGKPRKFNTGTTIRPEKPIKIPALDKQIKELKKEGIKFKRGRGNPAHPDEDVKRGRGTKKIPVVGIVERGGDVVAKVMRSLTYHNLKEMVQKNVDEDDAVLVTDEYSGYNRINNIIEHIKIDHQRLYSYKGVNTNTIESFWAIIKRQIIGQNHQVSPKFLSKYVAEAVFKFNNRHVDDMFETLVKNSMKRKI